MKYCSYYVGVSCVNGMCPKACQDACEDIDCEDCYYYEGCTDCALYDTEYCPEGSGA